jgi:hypothetical protein
MLDADDTTIDQDTERRAMQVLAALLLGAVVVGACVLRVWLA